MKKKLSVFIFLTVIGVFLSKGGIAQTIVQRLSVIDCSLAGHQALAFTKSSDGQVLILPKSGNPLEQIRIALTEKKYDEIHIYANVKHGSIVFNSLILTSGELQVQSGLLGGFKDLVSDSCHIVIHGDPGAEWLSLFKAATGIDIVTE